LAQPLGRRMKPVVLERVDGGFHAVLIKPEGHRTHKGRRGEAASPAERGRGLSRGQHRHGDGVAAALAAGAALDGKLGPATIANWHG